MRSHNRVIEALQRVRYIMYAVPAVFVAVGLLLAARAIIAEPPGWTTVRDTLIGFLLVVGALGGAMILSAWLRLATRLSALNESMAELQATLSRLEARSNDRKPGPAETELVNLARFGRGDPSLLASASVEEAAFPRLADLAEHGEEPTPRRPVAENRRGEPTNRSTHRPPVLRFPAADTVDVDKTEQAQVAELMHRWRAAVGSGDLAACHTLFPVLADASGPELVGQMSDELECVTAFTEERLRRRFAACVRGRDLANALAVGEQICDLLPDSGIAEDFRRLERQLKLRLAESATQARRAAGT